MKILRLQSENIKRIKVVDITPTGPVVVIGGPNDSGKTSTLDSIEMALGGASRVPPQPVRKGQKSAKVRLDLGESIEVGPDVIVKLTLTASGGRQLVVENRDGFISKSPQALLDKLYSEIAFDPLEFEREDDRTQAEILRQLVGLDTTTLDQRREAAYTERSLVNRELKAAQIDAETLPRYTEAPHEEISIAGIAQELKDAEGKAKAAQEAQRQVDQYERNVIRTDEQIARHNDRITELEKLIKDSQSQIQSLTSELLEVAVARKQTLDQLAMAKANAEDASAAIPDTAAIRHRLTEAEAINQKVRANQRKAAASLTASTVKAMSDELTTLIERIDAEKTAAIAAATFPVPGLGLDENGVTFEGLPFSQASSSTRTLVSMSIAVARHPKLRVALVRDGSLIGSDKLQLIAQIAEANKSQVWIEMMQEQPNDRTTVFLEDGTVVTPAASSEPAETVIK